jgi:hypothetical protein
MKEGSKVLKDRGVFVKGKFVMHECGSKWITLKCGVST